MIIPRYFDSGSRRTKAAVVSLLKDLGRIGCMLHGGILRILSMLCLR